MVRYLVRVRVAILVEGDALTAEGLARLVRDELARLAEGADFAGTKADNVFDIFGEVEASSPIDAVLAGTTNLRTAAHAAGAYTDGWPEAHQWPAWMQEQAVEATPVADGPHEVRGGDTLAV